MSVLKFRAIVGKELEIEGEADLVVKLLDKYYTPITTIGASKSESDKLEEEVSRGESSVTLMDLVYKNKERTEAEWLLIYGYFLNKGQFGRSELLEMYRQTQRYSENRRKNLSFNLRVAIKNGWMNAVGQNSFSLAPEGKVRLGEIVG